MKLLDLTLPTPAENLALDEALLDCAEAGEGGEVLRFWESNEYFVVVGYANKVEVETNRDACQSLNIPILRRCSGGGTVLQGPGCLNYTLILRIESFPALSTIPGTNTFVMERQAAALRGILGDNVGIRGHTDLALGQVKFSGNAQRRKREYLIFHGAFLLNFDLDLIEKALRMPSKEPDYRESRSHRDFLTNINLPSDAVKNKLRTVWECSEESVFPGFPQRVPTEVARFMDDKYRRDEWNFKF